MKNSFKSNLVLLMTAVIWGGGLVAQKAGAVLQPFTYNGIRMFIGGLALIPVIYLLKVAGKDKSAGSSREVKRDEKEDKKNLLIGGICCGCFLCLATSLQQFGFYFETSAGKTGFITSLYIVNADMGQYIVRGIWLLHAYYGRKERGISTQYRRTVYPAMCSCVFCSHFGSRLFFAEVRWNQTFMCAVSYKRCHRNRLYADF